MRSSVTPKPVTRSPVTRSPVTRKDATRKDATRKDATRAVPSRATGAAAPPAALPADADPAGGLVLDAQDVGGSVRILRVSRPVGFSFRAGQAVKLGMKGVPVRRTYSIASAPHEPVLEFCIERVPGGVFSSVVSGLAPGARLELAPKPKGSFVLQSGKSAILMVATVTGIAPLRSMLRDALAARGRAAQFWILHGASYADELPYQAELAALEQADARVHYLPTVSRPESPRNQGWAGRRGRVDAHVLALAESLGPKGNVAVYACGHPDMVRNVQSSLGAIGYDVSSEDFA